MSEESDDADDEPADGSTGGDTAPHRFDPDASAKLEEVERYRYLSRDELVSALDPDPSDVVVDVGSGTGFYTREIAPFVSEVIALDLQPSMHRQFAAHGVPSTVSQVIAKASHLPLNRGSVDGAYSTMTFHEYDPGGIEEIFQALRPGGRFVVADWSAEGSGDRGPPVSSRAGPAEAAETVERAGFEIEAVRGRPETFLIVAMRP